MKDTLPGLTGWSRCRLGEARASCILVNILTNISRLMIRSGPSDYEFNVNCSALFCKQLRYSRTWDSRAVNLSGLETPGQYLTTWEQVLNVGIVYYPLITWAKYYTIMIRVGGDCLSKNNVISFSFSASIKADDCYQE